MVRIRVASLFAPWCGLLVPTSALAAIDYSSIGSTYQQNFDSLQNTVNVTHTFTHDVTLPGWHLFRVVGGNPSNSTPVPVTSYRANHGTMDGQFYSYGAVGSSERALGAAGTGNFAGATQVTFDVVVGWIAFSVTNNTGSNLSEFTVGFNGEEWRQANVDSQPMVFEYGFGSTFAGVSSWTAPGGNFDWSSPVHTGASAAVDGNTVGRVPNRGGTISDLDWSPGDTLWLRWVELNDFGVDHGLAIDDFSFSADVSAIPEPGAAVFGWLVSAVLALAAGGRRWLYGFRGWRRNGNREPVAGSRC